MAHLTWFLRNVLKKSSFFNVLVKSQFVGNTDVAASSYPGSMPPTLRFAESPIVQLLCLPWVVHRYIDKETEVLDG